MKSTVIKKNIFIFSQRNLKAPETIFYYYFMKSIVIKKIKKQIISQTNLICSRNYLFLILFYEINSDEKI